ncbi:Uncharacterised protein [Chlamydia trachomatis]|nr:Uncharacterised protein [Chlamydia trachomatis]CRI74487.1 Uncharacterised protein [Chlamydia trachomatis]
MLEGIRWSVVGSVEHRLGGNPGLINVSESNCALRYRKQGPFFGIMLEKRWLLKEILKRLP